MSSSAADDEPVNTEDPVAALPKSPRSTYLDFMKTRSSLPRRDLPRMALDDPEYGSTLLMLKRTAAEVDEYCSSLGAANAIVELPTSENVRRVIAKMFADPRNADAISEAEWRRREQAYQASRDKFGAKIEEVVKKDKDALQTELTRMSELHGPAAAQLGAH